MPPPDLGDQRIDLALIGSRAARIVPIAAAATGMFAGTGPARLHFAPYLRSISTTSAVPEPEGNMSAVQPKDLSRPSISAPQFHKNVDGFGMTSERSGHERRQTPLAD